ncbi:DUF4240 domain-containing protein [Nonomuraea cavernae]|nr:DUF4240 domain-containing protein [Nonomuraea cavernae]MCA2191007.1 DUF4240 domain-containing protein [Nonomuraea cavernae]
MSIAEFWTLIEQSRGETQTKVDRVNWLKRQLQNRGMEAVLDFWMWLCITRERVNTWDMFGAFYNVFNIGSSDRFMDFQYWLIGLGKKDFDTIAIEPDSLISFSRIRHLIDLDAAWSPSDRESGWSAETSPYFGALASVAFDTYEALTGSDSSHLSEEVRASRGVEFGSAYDFNGEEWNVDDPSEVRDRLPRIFEYIQECS